VAHNPDENHCSNFDYGASLLQRWKSSALVACGTQTAAVAEDFVVESPASSALIEHHLWQTRHSGPDYYYSISNVLFYPARDHYALQCAPTAELFAGGRPYTFHPKLNPQHQILDWIRKIEFHTDAVRAESDAAAALRRALTENDALDTAQLKQLDEFLVTHSSGSPVVASGVSSRSVLSDALVSDSTFTLFVERDCNPPFNPFHCCVDLVNAFMAAHTFRVDFAQMRIVFIDSVDASPFAPIWRGLAGRGVFTRAQWSAAFDAANDATANVLSLHTKHSRPLLLRRAAFSIPSGSNFVWKDAWQPDPCASVSPILRGFSRLAADSLWADFPQEKREIDAERARREAPGGQRLLLLASRKSAKYRRIRDEDGLVRELQRTLGARYEVRSVDFGALDFHAQTALVLRASMLIGMHGAALTHILFHGAPERFALLELFRDPTDHARMYENMAMRLGMTYYSWVNANPVARTDAESPVDAAQLASSIQSHFEAQK
jgi:hypothetical protein